jgi:hypothetical protein
MNLTETETETPAERLQSEHLAIPAEWGGEV